MLEKEIINLEQLNFKDNTLLPVIPLRNIVLFPQNTLSFDIGRLNTLVAVNKALDEHSYVFVVSQRNTEPSPSFDDLQKMGTVARVKSVIPISKEIMRVTVFGVERAHVLEYKEMGKYLAAHVAVFDTTPASVYEAEALRRRAYSLVEDYHRVTLSIPNETLIKLRNSDDANTFVDIVAGSALVRERDKTTLMLETDCLERLEILCNILVAEIEIVKLDRKINAKVTKQIDTNQREYYLRERLKAIHDELGDTIEEEIAEFKKRIEESGMPQEAKDKAAKEIKRLSKMSGNSPESGVIRNYLDWLCDIPWTKYTTDNDDLSLSEKILNQDHYGLEKIKERILEYLAVLQLTKGLKGPILCFVGPPGVGKTSIGQSIARSLGRSFVRFALGGVRDEAEIRGHRRTYIGAIPGRIVTNLKLSGSRNPVILLDEIDKMSSDFKGDPAAALLEVLDPEQNHSFRDHFIEVPLDLSKVLFLTTANSLDTIPAPLLDRLEIIHLSGYSEDEKYEIAKRFILPKQEEAHGLERGTVEISKKAMHDIINLYTRESGVRSLEREIAKICRKIAKKIVYDRLDAKSEPYVVDQPEPDTVDSPLVISPDVVGADGIGADSVGGASDGLSRDRFAIRQVLKRSHPDRSGVRSSASNGSGVSDNTTSRATSFGKQIGKLRVVISPEMLEDYLGIPRYKVRTKLAENEIGTATGLAWTATGGQTLNIEVSLMGGKGDIVLTGHLGDVMKESARTAISLVRAEANSWGIDPDVFAKTDIHIHVPEGAIKKDGPSAGITIATAILSAFTNRPSDANVAMTGELTLRGKILAIGGLKEKTLAAHRAGIKKVIIPLENEKDVAELPPKVKKDIQIILTDNISTVFKNSIL
ncbi:MAG: endopeptidase La [Firmicutes bacterium]|nr:endopeptidase La [Bacillota bacterium]